jgi:hypothetical protein
MANYLSTRLKGWPHIATFCMDFLFSILSNTNEGAV